MGFEGISIILVGSAYLFFHLYTLFRERDGDDWTSIISQNLANLFFGLGLIIIDVMLYLSFLYASDEGFSFYPVLRSVSLIIIFLTLAVAILMILKTFFLFLQRFFVWVAEKTGLIR